jgi:MFS family permease
LILWSYFFSASFVFGAFFLVAGTLYAFSAYGPELKVKLGYSQTDINTVSSVGDLGLYFGGLPMGAICDFFGAQVTYSLSGVLGFLGYLLMWLGAQGIIGNAPLLMALYLAFAGFGSYAGYTAGLVTNVRNFSPENRGKVRFVSYNK